MNSCQHIRTVVEEKEGLILTSCTACGLLISNYDTLDTIRKRANMFDRAYAAMQNWQEPRESVHDMLDRVFYQYFGETVYAKKPTGYVEG